MSPHDLNFKLFVVNQTNGSNCKRDQININCSPSNWAAGHESLHSVGLEDQTYVGNIAYRNGYFAQKRAFKKLSKEKQLINPDHLMSIVWP